jgi:LPXTG-motif cell wall-anchored protein
VVASGIAFNTKYSVTFDTSGANTAALGVTGALTLTTADQGTDTTDSDATLVGGAATVAVLTGGPGANNHTYDVGFVSGPTMTTTSSTTTTSTTTTTAVVRSETTLQTTTTAATQVAGVTTTRPSASLATTGGDARSLSWIGLGLLLCGAALSLTHRRKDR